MPIAFYMTDQAKPDKENIQSMLQALQGNGLPLPEIMMTDKVRASQ
jgi:hypothetical protein